MKRIMSYLKVFLAVMVLAAFMGLSGCGDDGGHGDFGHGGSSHGH